MSNNTLEVCSVCVRVCGNEWKIFWNVNLLFVAHSYDFFSLHIYSIGCGVVVVSVAVVVWIAATVSLLTFLLNCPNKCFGWRVYLFFLFLCHSLLPRLLNEWIWWNNLIFCPFTLSPSSSFPHFDLEDFHCFYYLLFYCVHKTNWSIVIVCVDAENWMERINSASSMSPQYLFFVDIFRRCAALLYIYLFIHL